MFYKSESISGSKDQYGDYIETLQSYTFGKYNFTRTEVNQVPLQLGYSVEDINEPAKLDKFLSKAFDETDLSFEELKEAGFVPVCVNTQFVLKNSSIKLADYSSDPWPVRKILNTLGFFSEEQIPFYVNAEWENGFDYIDTTAFQKGFTVYLARNLKGVYNKRQEWEGNDSKMDLYDINTETFYDLFKKRNLTAGWEELIAKNLCKLYTKKELESINLTALDKYDKVEWHKSIWKVPCMWDVAIVPLLNKWPKMRLDDSSFKSFSSYYEELSQIFEGAVFKNHGCGLDSIMIDKLDSASNNKTFVLIQQKSKELQDLALAESKVIESSVSNGNLKVKDKLKNIISINKQIVGMKDILGRAKSIKEMVSNAKSKSEYNIVYSKNMYDKLNNILDYFSGTATKLDNTLNETISKVESNLSGVYSLVNKRIERNNSEIMNSIQNSAEGTLYYMEPPRGIDYEDMNSGAKYTVVGGYVELIKKGMYDSDNMKVVVNKIPEPFETNTPFSNATSKFKSGRIAASIGYGAFQFATGEMRFPVKYIVKRGMLPYAYNIEDLLNFFE